ncbi:hypothetical protein BDQ17DRAFT_1355060, partial [Cyathus striatus]
MQGFTELIEICKITSLPIPLSLVRSSYFPNETELSAIENHVIESKQAISFLEEKLSYIRKFSAFRHSLTAPIRKLPNDVLSKIFLRVCERGVGIGMRNGQI